MVNNFLDVVDVCLLSSLLRFPAAATAADFAPRAPHGRSQGRARPQVQARRAQGVAPRQHLKRIDGVVFHVNVFSSQRGQDGVEHGRTPEQQEQDHHHHDDQQGFLLAVPVRARRLPHHLVPGYHQQLDGHGDLREDDHQQADSCVNGDVHGYVHRHHILDDQQAVRVHPAVRVDAHHHPGADETAVEEGVAHGKVAVKLCEQKRHNVDPKEGGDDVKRAVFRGEVHAHVEEKLVEDPAARQGVADACVQHEQEAVFLQQSAGVHDAARHAAGHQHRTCPRQHVEGEKEIICCAAEVHTQRNQSQVHGEDQDGGVQSEQQPVPPQQQHDSQPLSEQTGGLLMSCLRPFGVEVMLVLFEFHTHLRILNAF